METTLKYDSKKKKIPRKLKKSMLPSNIALVLDFEHLYSSFMLSYYTKKKMLRLR